MLRDVYVPSGNEGYCNILWYLEVSGSALVLYLFEAEAPVNNI
jgi:hypothetical protein